MDSAQNSSVSRALPTRKCCTYSLGFNPVARRNRRRSVRSPSFAWVAIAKPVRFSLPCPMTFSDNWRIPTAAEFCGIAIIGSVL
jgi:hypothetical protein